MADNDQSANEAVEAVEAVKDGKAPEKSSETKEAEKAVIDIGSSPENNDHRGEHSKNTEKESSPAQQLQEEAKRNVESDGGGDDKGTTISGTNAISHKRLNGFKIGDVVKNTEHDNEDMIIAQLLKYDHPSKRQQGKVAVVFSPSKKRLYTSKLSSLKVVAGAVVDDKMKEDIIPLLEDFEKKFHDRVMFPFFCIFFCSLH